MSAPPKERFFTVTGTYDSDSIKEKESRLKEISDLRTHIINYAKTKDVYKAFVESGYSREFEERHRKEILLHKAAKEAFKKLDGKKLPKVKELSEEYSKILQEKRKLYESYKETRKEMMDYQIAKQDIDRFLEIEEKQKDIEQKKEIQL